MRRPAERVGISVWTGREWVLETYAQLAGRAAGVAAQLSAAGVGRDEIVAVDASRPNDVAALFFGARLAGAIALPLAPRSAVAGRDAVYLDAIVEAAAPSVIASIGTGTWKGVTPSVDYRELSSELTGEPAPTSLSPIAFVQFTSGSTTTPRGLLISADNVAANVGAIHQWLGWSAADTAISWLPLHHDMGLVGLFLGSVLAQTSLWQLEPGQFLADPGLWLRSPAAGRPVITAAPPFGYAYAARRGLTANGRKSVDLGSWRAAVVGAETVPPALLTYVSDRLKPYGFDADVFRPAYGLAESTLMVSGRDASSAMRAVSPAWSAMGLGRRVVIEDVRTLSHGPARGSVISCGVPVAGTVVTVADERGRELPEGWLGEIHVRGRSVSGGFLSRSGALPHLKPLATGDAGFILDGELFVVGRLGDRLKTHGRTLFAEQLESLLGSVLGIPTTDVLVVAADNDGVARVAVLVADRHPDCVDKVAAVLRPVVGPHVAIVSRSVPWRTVPRTTSGKPRRHAVWEAVVRHRPDDDPGTCSTSSRAFP